MTSEATVNSSVGHEEMPEFTKFLRGYNGMQISAILKTTIDDLQIAIQNKGMLLEAADSTIWLSANAAQAILVWINDVS